MQEDHKLPKGPIPADPELRWIADLRDLLQLGTFGFVGPRLSIRNGTTDNELHVYFELTRPLWKEVRKNVVATCHWYVRTVKEARDRFVLQAVRVENSHVRLLVYRKSEKIR